jgi:multidrug efflux pump subunit AcrA (membrane-fusion protein)
LDIVRQPIRGGSRLARLSIAAGGLLVIVLALASLKPAAPGAGRATLWVDSVRRGEMVIEVRGPGTLVPEHVRFITAVSAGRVDRLLAQPGQIVQPQTVLLELSNPDVQIQSLQAEEQLTAAQAQLLTLRTALQVERLAQEGTVASARTVYADAKRQANVAGSLVAQQLIAVNEAALAKDRAAEAETRLGLEQERLAMITQTIDSKVAVQRSQVDRLRAIAAFQQNVVRSLEVSAGDSGVVSDLTLQLGQWVLAGTVLAKVVQPGKLKAVLQIPETQAKDVAIGQKATIDTRNGITRGRVVRMDPNAINGTVVVDVALDGPLPPGARPDLSVDGTIEIDRLRNVLYTGRPASSQPNSTIAMFKLTADGDHADRVQVQLGRTSASTMEIKRGLSVGDSVVLSDVSQWDNVDRVAIKR